MSVKLKCNCGSDVFIPISYLIRNPKGEVLCIPDGMDYMCATCNEITTFYTEKVTEGINDR